MTNDKKKSFMFYYDYEEYFELLDDHEAMVLIKALINYAKNGTEPKLEGKVLAVFTAIRMQIDRDNRKYEEKCRKNRETALKREENRRKKSENGSFFCSDKAQTSENATDKDNDKEKEKENDDDKYIDTDTLPLNPPQGESERAYISACGADIININYFEDFWEIYPKKADKRKTIAEWNKIAPDSELAHKICAAALKQRTCDQWCEQKGRFIPYPANWLSGRHWEDSVTVPDTSDLPLY